MSLPISSMTASSWVYLLELKLGPAPPGIIIELGDTDIGDPGPGDWESEEPGGSDWEYRLPRLSYSCCKWWLVQIVKSGNIFTV